MAHLRNSRSKSFRLVKRRKRRAMSPNRGLRGTKSGSRFEVRGSRFWVIPGHCFSVVNLDAVIARYEPQDLPGNCPGLVIPFFAARALPRHRQEFDAGDSIPIRPLRLQMVSLTVAYFKGGYLPVPGPHYPAEQLVDERDDPLPGAERFLEVEVPPPRPAVSVWARPNTETSAPRKR